MKPMSIALSKGAGSIALKVTIIVAAAVGGAGVVSSNVFAALSATATNTSGGSVTTGTLKLESVTAQVGSFGFTTALPLLAPGDTATRYVNLVNSGTLDGSSPTLRISSSETNTLVTNASAGLQIMISGCTTSWNVSLGTCSGSTTVLGLTPASTLRSGETSITLPTLVAGATNYLKVSTSLPNSTENVLNGVLPVNTIQGLTNTLTWAFTIQQRTATTSSD